MVRNKIFFIDIIGSKNWIPQTIQDTEFIFDPDANDRILFSKDEDGPIVRVFAGLIYELAVSERNFLVTRYDGYSDKIWIRRNDFQAEQMTLGLPGIPIFPHSALAA